MTGHYKFYEPAITSWLLNRIIWKDNVFGYVVLKPENDIRNTT